MYKLICFMVYWLFVFSVSAGVLSNSEFYYDYRSHNLLETNQLVSIEDLANRYLDDQYQYLWVAPPAPETPLYQKGHTIALLDYKGFDYDFLTGLVAVTNDGVRTYPVWVYERESDSSIVIANLDGKELVVFDREKGYSPDWFVYNELSYFSDKKQDQQDWLKACYDPSRIVMKYDLVVGEDDLIAYVWSNSQEPSLFESIMTMSLAMDSSTVISNLQFKSIEKLTNGVMELTVEWPSGDLSDDELDFFVCNNILSKNWFVEDTQEVDTSTNVYTWVDYNATNDTSRFYTCWTLYDSDGDGVSDGRETLLYGTSVTNSDSDGDFLTDGEEINAGLNPNYYSDSFADPDGDGVVNLYEIKHNTVYTDATSTPTATITVSSDTYMSIQNAINSCLNDYDIVYVEDGMYDYNQNNINFNGKKILVYSTGGATVDADYNYGFVFNSNESRESILSGFTIKHAFYNDSVDCLSGAVYCSGASPVILRCNIIDNGWNQGRTMTASYGGGVSCENHGSPLFMNLTITNNAASVGAGIYINVTNGMPEIVDCNISENISRSSGGGFYINGMAMMSNCVVRSNETVSLGAGGYAVGDVSINNSDISFNSFIHDTGRQGGGLYIANGVDVYNCNVVSNTGANLGGGVCFSGYGSIKKSYIAYNEVEYNGGSFDGSGGGLYIKTTGQDIEVVDCEIDNNIASESGGGGGIATDYNSRIDISHCWIEDNEAGFGAGICLGKVSFLFIDKVGKANIANSYIANNNASVSGGAVYACSLTNSVDIAYTALKSNYAESGGGIFSQGTDVTVEGSQISFNIGSNTACGIGIYV